MVNIEQLRENLIQQINQQLRSRGLGNNEEAAAVMSTTAMLLTDDAMCINNGVYMTNGETTLRIRKHKSQIYGGLAFVPEALLSTEFQKINTPKLVDGLAISIRSAQTKGGAQIIANFVTEVALVCKMVEECVTAFWNTPGFIQALMGYQLTIPIASGELMCSVGPSQANPNQYVVNLDMNPRYKMLLKDDNALYR